MRQSNQNGAPASLDACCCVSVHMIFLCTQYFDAHTDAHNILHLLPWSSGHLLCFLAHHILVHRCIDAHKILRLLCFSAKCYEKQSICLPVCFCAQNIFLWLKKMHLQMHTKYYTCLLCFCAAVVQQEYFCSQNIGVNIGAHKML